MTYVRELRKSLAEAWSHLDVPELPIPYKDDWEYYDLYPLIVNRRWNDIDFDDPKDRHLAHECWWDTIPTQDAQIYYYATFLDYCLRFYENHKEDEYPDAGIPYLCLIRISRILHYYYMDMTRKMIYVVHNALKFIWVHRECYGYEKQDIVDILAQAIDAWSAVLKRLGQSRDKSPPTEDP